VVPHLRTRQAHCCNDSRWHFPITPSDVLRSARCGNSIKFIASLACQQYSLKNNNFGRTSARLLCWNCWQWKNRCADFASNPLNSC